MVDLDGVRLRRGRRAGTRMRMPRDPDMVLKIIELKDNGKSFREIGKIVERSPQAPFLLYHRWREWAYAQETSETTSET